MNKTIDQVDKEALFAALLTISGCATLDEAKAESRRAVSRTFTLRHTFKVGGPEDSCKLCGCYASHHSHGGAACYVAGDLRLD